MNTKVYSQKYFTTLVHKRHTNENTHIQFLGKIVRHEKKLIHSKVKQKQQIKKILTHKYKCYHHHEYDCKINILKPSQEVVLLYCVCRCCFRFVSLHVNVNELF